MSTLSVFELRTVPAGSGAGVDEEAVDIVESLRSSTAGFEEEVPFVVPFEVLADGPAGLGEGFVDTDGPASGERWMQEREADQGVSLITGSTCTALTHLLIQSLSLRHFCSLRALSVQQLLSTIRDSRCR